MDGYVLYLATILCGVHSTSLVHALGVLLVLGSGKVVRVRLQISLRVLVRTAGGFCAWVLRMCRLST